MSTSITAIATPLAAPPAIGPTGMGAEEPLSEEICAPDVAEVELETKVTVTTCTEAAPDGCGGMSI
jgi:hypothetical protein